MLWLHQCSTIVGLNISGIHSALFVHLYLQYAPPGQNSNTDGYVYIPQMTGTIGHGLNYCRNPGTCSVVEHYPLDM